MGKPAAARLGTREPADTSTKSSLSGISKTCSLQSPDKDIHRGGIRSKASCMQYAVPLCAEWPFAQQQIQFRLHAAFHPSGRWRLSDCSPGPQRRGSGASRSILKRQIRIASTRLLVPLDAISKWISLGRRAPRANHDDRDAPRRRAARLQSEGEEPKPETEGETKAVDARRAGRLDVVGFRA